MFKNLRLSLKQKDYFMVSSIRNYMPTFSLPTIANSRQIVNNLTKLALPIIAFVAMEQVRSADAGPVSYAACVIAETFALMTMTFGACGPACAAAAASHCLPVLAAPTP